MGTVTIVRGDATAIIATKVLRFARSEVTSSMKRAL